MVTLAGGVVVLVRFPFSDLTHSKVRPALVLADAHDEEWVLCQLTSNAYADARAIAIPQAAFATGSLDKVSYARPTKLFTAHVSLVASRVGVLRPQAFAQVLESVTQAGALSRKAEELGVRPEDLLRAVALDVIEGRDEPFLAIAQRVIEKNAELYRRLA